MTDGLPIDAAVSGFKVSEFSESTLNLQNTFCCQDPSTKRILKWFNNGAQVYYGANNILNSAPFNLGKWKQDVKKSNSNTYTVLSGTTLELPFESTFLFVKICWPNSAIDYKKIVEVILEGTYLLDENIVSSIDFEKDYTTPIELKYLLKDFLIFNLGQVFTGKVKINNTSPYDITYSILECSSYDLTEVPAPLPPDVVTTTIYWGTTLKTDSYNANDVLNLESKEKVKTIDKIGTREIDAGPGEYIMLAFPQDWGNIAMKVEGFDLVVSDDSPYAINVINPATGVARMYNVWRSEHPNIGLTYVQTY